MNMNKTKKIESQFEEGQCEYCGGRGGILGLNHVHINVFQTIQKKYFCSKECKQDWCINRGRAKKGVKKQLKIRG